MSSSYTDLFSGALLPPIYNQFKSIAFSTNITLSWPTQFQNGNNVVSSIMNFTPSTGGLTVTMPDATQNSVGAQFLANNLSAHSFNLLNNAAGLISAIAGPSVNLIYLADNSTVAGTWFQVPFGGGYSAVTSVGAVAVSANDIANLTIGNSPITTTGNLTFHFAGDLAALINFNTTTGFAARTGVNTWALRTLTGTADQIVITSNADGVSGDPVISLATDITGITSIQVGNIEIAGNTISAFSGSDIILEPQIDGAVKLSLPLDMLAAAPVAFYNSASTFYFALAGGEVTQNISLFLPDTPPTIGQVPYYASTNQLGWLSIAGFVGTSTLNSLPKFVDTIGTIGDTGIIVDNSNNMSGVNSIIAQSIRIAFSGANTISTSAGNLTFSPSGSNDVQSSNNLSVLSGNSLKLFNVAGNGYCGLKGTAAGAAATSVWALPPTDGAAGTFLQTDGAFGLSFTAITAQFLAKAYATFNGTGSVTISNQQGISSITYGGVGIYNVTFSTAFANSNYGFTYSLETPSVGAMPGFMVIAASPARTTTTCTFNAFNAAGTLSDFLFVTLAFWGTQ